MRMAEQERTESFWISEQHPQVKVHMRVSMSLPGKQIWPVSIGIPLSIPQSLLDPLWSRSGISLGVHDVLGDKTDVLKSTSIEIEFPALQFSVDLEQLSADEILVLAKKLEALTRDIVLGLASECKI